MNFASWRWYFSTSYQLTAKVELSVEVSYTAAAYKDASTGDASDHEETRLRLQRRERLSEFFTTECSVEWAVQAQSASAPAQFPMMRIAGQFAF